MQTLHESLQRSKREVWVDWEDIPPSAEWLREIEQALGIAGLPTQMQAPQKRKPTPAAPSIQGRSRDRFARKMRSTGRWRRA